MLQREGQGRVARAIAREFETRPGFGPRAARGLHHRNSTNYWDIAVKPSRRIGSHHVSATAQGVAAINAAAIIFGTAALYGKLNVSPFWIVAMRACFGASALALVGGLTRALPRLWLSSWRIIALSAALIAAHWVLFFFSVQLAGVAVATLTFATCPLFTVIVEAAHKRQFPRAIEIVAAGVILIGVALLVEPHGSDQTKLGTVAGLASAASYALFWRANQKASQRLRLAQLSLGQNIVVLGLLAPILIFVGPAPSGTTAWTLLMALGVFNTAGMLLYAFALKHISASTCSGFVALEPVYAIAFAALLFKEPLTGWMAVSLILIIGASLALLKLEQPPSPT